MAARPLDAPETQTSEDALSAHVQDTRLIRLPGTRGQRPSLDGRGTVSPGKVDRASQQGQDDACAAAIACDEDAGNQPDVGVLVPG